MFDEFVYVRFDQIQIYDHALTAFSGMNAYLFIADHDDFLLLPRVVEAPVLHNTLLHGMWLLLHVHMHVKWITCFCACCRLLAGWMVFNTCWAGHLPMCNVTPQRPVPLPTQLQGGS